MSFIEAMKSNWNKLYALNVRHKTFGERNEEREHKKRGMSNKSFLRLIDAPINVLEMLIYRCL